MHFLILCLALLSAAGVYILGTRAPTKKWELLRTVSNGKAGLYKKRKYIKFGKFERIFTTYAILLTPRPGYVWSFVWRLDRIASGGRYIGLRDTIDTQKQSHLCEIGFAPPLGLYTVYTGEEDNLSYPEREQYLLSLYKKTAVHHKKWRNDPAFFIRKTLARWKLSVLTFVPLAGLGFWAIPYGVEAPQVIVWTLLGMIGLGLLAATYCAMKSKNSVMWLQASGTALLLSCLVSLVTLPSLLLGINGLSFATLCEGSVPVERSWTGTTGSETIHYLDITLPATCQFDAHKVPVESELYYEFQMGRRVIDVVVSQGILGYKRIKLIGA